MASKPTISPKWLFACTTMLLLPACGTLASRAEAVAITASRSEVENCERVGLVTLGTYDNEFDARQRDLRMETARVGGNVLLVDSFASATGGTAYNCLSINKDRIAS